MAYYAHCSDLVNDYSSKIEDWSYVYCKNAQKKENVKDIKVIVKEKSLAFTLYDVQRNLIIVSVRATVPCYLENII